jgi:tetratricopeptide (TPR) repeat protein
MDAISAVLILAGLLALLLISRALGPGGTSWTFRIPLGRMPNVERSKMARLETHVIGGESPNVVMSDATSTQLLGELPTGIESSQSKESLAQRVLEQLLLPKHLLRDIQLQNLFGQGSALLEQKNYDQAIVIFRQAVDRAHHNLYLPHATDEIEGKIAALAHYNLATGLLARRDVDAAIIEFREGLRLAPNLASLHDGLGNALSIKGEQDPAATEFREAARLDPNLAMIHSNFGQAFVSTGDVEGAIREYQRALNLNPNLPEAQEHLRTLLQQKSASGKAP